MRWLLPALLLAGCPLPPVESGCHLPVEPAVDGRAVSFRVEGCGRADLDARLLGTGNLDLSWRVDGNTLIPSVSGGVAGGELGGLVLQGVVRLEGETPRLWRQGYGSEAFAGVVELEPWGVDDDGLAQSAAEGPDTAWSSWWHGLVGTDAASVLVGALDAERFAWRMAAQPAGDGTELQLVWGGRGDVVALGPGEAVELEPLWIGVDGDALDLHARYAQAVAARRPPLLERPPVAWSTGPAFGEAVTEADVRRHLDLLAGGPVEAIRLGDGWAPPGSDDPADARFPGGLPQLAADLAAAGFDPGLWMTPLCVDRGTATYADHPDWWVQTRAGGEADCGGCADCAVLDATHPDAADWLTEQIRAAVDAGWAHLQLDALSAGAEPGLRHGGGTALQAWRAAMEAVAAGLDEETPLLAGEAPLLPSVGWFAAVRTGPSTISPDARRAAARNAAARSWQNGAWWWNDAGALLVGDDDEAAGRGARVAAAVSGGPWGLGDDLSQLPPDRLAAMLDPELLALADASFEPRDPLAFPSEFAAAPPDAGAAVPVRWQAEDHVALLNLGSTTVTVEAPAGTELLTGEIRTASGSVSLAPGDGQIWRLP